MSRVTPVSAWPVTSQYRTGTRWRHALKFLSRADLPRGRTPAQGSLVPAVAAAHRVIGAHPVHWARCLQAWRHVLQQTNTAEAAGGRMAAQTALQCRGMVVASTLATSRALSMRGVWAAAIQVLNVGRNRSLASTSVVAKATAGAVVERFASHAADSLLMPPQATCNAWCAGTAAGLAAVAGAAPSGGGGASPDSGSFNAPSDHGAWHDALAHATAVFQSSAHANSSSTGGVPPRQVLAAATAFANAGFTDAVASLWQRHGLVTEDDVFAARLLLLVGAGHAARGDFDKAVLALDASLVDLACDSEPNGGGSEIASLLLAMAMVRQNALLGQVIQKFASFGGCDGDLVYGMCTTALSLVAEYETLFDVVVGSCEGPATKAFPVQAAAFLPAALFAHVGSGSLGLRVRAATVAVFAYRLDDARSEGLLLSALGHLHAIVASPNAVRREAPGLLPLRSALAGFGRFLAALLDATLRQGDTLVWHVLQLAIVLAGHVDSVCQTSTCLGDRFLARSVAAAFDELGRASFQFGVPLEAPSSIGDTHMLPLLLRQEVAIPKAVKTWLRRHDGWHAPAEPATAMALVAPNETCPIDGSASHWGSMIAQIAILSSDTGARDLLLQRATPFVGAAAAWPLTLVGLLRDPASPRTLHAPWLPSVLGWGALDSPSSADQLLPSKPIVASVPTTVSATDGDLQMVRRLGRHPLAIAFDAAAASSGPHATHPWPNDVIGDLSIHAPFGPWAEVVHAADTNTSSADHRGPALLKALGLLCARYGTESRHVPAAQLLARLALPRSEAADADAADDPSPISSEAAHGLMLAMGVRLPKLTSGLAEGSGALTHKELLRAVATVTDTAVHVRRRAFREAVWHAETTGRVPASRGAAWSRPVARAVLEARDRAAVRALCDTELASLGVSSTPSRRALEAVADPAAFVRIAVCLLDGSDAGADADAASRAKLLRWMTASVDGISIVDDTRDPAILEDVSVRIAAHMPIEGQREHFLRLMIQRTSSMPVRDSQPHALKRFVPFRLWQSLVHELVAADNDGARVIGRQPRRDSPSPPTANGVATEVADRILRRLRAEQSDDIDSPRLLIGLALVGHGARRTDGMAAPVAKRCRSVGRRLLEFDGASGDGPTKVLGVRGTRVSEHLQTLISRLALQEAARRDVTLVSARLQAEAKQATAAAPEATHTTARGPLRAKVFYTVSDSGDWSSAISLLASHAHQLPPSRTFKFAAHACVTSASWAAALSLLQRRVLADPAADAASIARFTHVVGQHAPWQVCLDLTHELLLGHGGAAQRLNDAGTAPVGADSSVLAPLLGALTRSRSGVPLSLRQSTLARIVAARGADALATDPLLCGEAAMALVAEQKRETDACALALVLRHFDSHADVVRASSTNPAASEPSAASPPGVAKPITLALLRLVQRFGRWPGTWEDAMRVAVVTGDPGVMKEVASTVVRATLARELDVEGRSPEAFRAAKAILIPAASTGLLTLQAGDWASVGRDPQSPRAKAMEAALMRVLTESRH